MGCDIHLYVETRKNDLWESADKWTPDKYEDGGRLKVDYGDSFYHDRNYDLFGILADVRNGYGFVRSDTGDGFKPISQPRGLPLDVTASVKAEAVGWGGDGHSHSHLTVAELMAYDWTQATTKRGWLGAYEYWDWSQRRRGRGEGPERYSTGVVGGGIQHITEAEMQQLVKDKTEGLQYQAASEALGGKRTFGTHYCQVSWDTPYYRRASEFLGHTLPRLWQLGAPENVRIVFWFDN